MRIISKFHDYYDKAMAYGQDPGLVYRREPEEHIFDPWPGPQWVLEFFRWQRSQIKSRLVLACFCGKCRHVWLREDFELTPEALGSHCSGRVWLTNEELTQCEIARVHSSYGDPIDYCESAIEGVSEYDGSTLSDEIFRQVKSPVFLLWAEGSNWSPEPIHLITNPRIATLGFTRWYDAFTAYQEITMFLGSQLAPEDSAPKTVGDDKTLASAKGFDEQSFRTLAPGNKKQNRKANRTRKRGNKHT